MRIGPKFRVFKVVNKKKLKVLPPDVAATQNI